MLDSFANYFWTHPLAIAGTAIAVIIILIWMTGSGSRQRFITFKRTKETDQLARDLSRIAAALERIARSQETPTDYVGRPIPPGWEENISSGEPSEEVASGPASAHANQAEAVFSVPGTNHDEAIASQHANPPAAYPTNGGQIPSAQPGAARQNQPTSLPNPLGRTADLLGKKKLDIPNPLYRPK